MVYGANHTEKICPECGKPRQNLSQHRFYIHGVPLRTKLDDKEPVVVDLNKQNTGLGSAGRRKQWHRIHRILRDEYGEVGR